MLDDLVGICNDVYVDAFVYPRCETTFFLFFFLLCLHRCTTAVRLMRIDGPRALNFLRSDAHRSTHTISHFFFFHALPYAACIECRFQMLADFASISTQDCVVAGGRSILINAMHGLVLLHTRSRGRRGTMGTRGIMGYDR